jgi:hypothetical protein
MMMPPMKITSITTANIKKVLSMVTPFVRTRHATKWYSSAHPPQGIEAGRHPFSTDNADTHDIDTWCDVGQ